MDIVAKPMFRISYSTPEQPNGVYYIASENAFNAETDFLARTHHSRESIISVEVRVGREWRKARESLSYEHEVETWYALYMTYNDDNQNYADYAFMTAGYQTAAEVHRANLRWLEEIFQRIDYTAENVAEMELAIPNVKELLQEYQSAKRDETSILAQSLKTQEKDREQRLGDVLDRNMDAYRREWGKASSEYLVADASFICAVKQAYKYLIGIHRFAPEEVDALLKMQNPLHEVAVKWQKRMDDLSGFSSALDAVIKNKTN